MKLEIEYDHKLSDDEESALCNDILYAKLQKTFDHGMLALRKSKSELPTAKWWLGRLEFEISLLRPIVVAIINNNPKMTDYDRKEVLTWGQSLVAALSESIRDFETN